MIAIYFRHLSLHRYFATTLIASKASISAAGRNASAATALVAVIK